MDFLERFKVATTTTGTGTLTLGSAATGFQGSSALTNGETYEYTLLDANGTGWESGLGTYTSSGTTLARTAIYASSNSGSAINLSSGSHTVIIGPTAQRTKALTLPTVTGTDAATTCLSNVYYLVDMSAWATADRNYTLPASPKIGDRVGIFITAGNASYELVIKGNTSQTINGGSAASEWSRLFITGEYAVLRYTASNTWIVEQDGRIPQVGALTNSYTISVSGSWSVCDFNGATVSVNRGSLVDTANDKVTPRRINAYSISHFVGQLDLAANKQAGSRIMLNGATQLTACGVPVQTNLGYYQLPCSIVYKTAALTDYFQGEVYQNDTTSESCAIAFSVVEIL